MAVSRQIVQCQVCETLTIIRIQIGYLEQHPLRVPCGSCGILISGTAFINQDKIDFRVEYQNATQVPGDTGDFHIEASPEFLTEKLKKLEKGGVPIFMSPFMIALSGLGHEGYEAFRHSTIRFSHLVREDWPRLRRINELWLGRKLPLLAKEVAGLLPVEQFPMKNELQCLMAIRRLNLFFLQSVLDSKRFESTCDLIFGEQKNSTTAKISQLTELAENLDKRGVLHRFDERILLVFGQFVDRFNYMIPALGLRFYKTLDPDILVQRGITTTSFEDLKQFFVDSYELAADLLTLLVGWNNVSVRGSWNQMFPKRKDVQTLDQFEDKPKGIRIQQFLTGAEAFDSLVKPQLDVPLRNAIAHGTYRYDGVSQQITYYPSGHETESDKQSIYLICFVRKCLDQFDSIHSLYELLYQTRKLLFLKAGQVPVP
ncbi:hypothetical protein D7V97_19550, partial [Corallococcus sp. CA053C]|uniref:hypothetical protein n=1 Tax=Corallococcus sp. CA053C TaxID=2316732 RepID=UPI000EA1AEF1